MKWTVILSPSATKRYKQLQDDVKLRVKKILHRLSEDPWGMPFRKLRGRPFYRIRAGDWRIVYSVDEEQRKVYVVAIDKRSRVYKRV